ncbi:MAG: glycosyltransferase family 4 protein [Nitrospirae bacterium]|nr:glycosyltransferase family 4 protein [Nitrospirota bacterium]
MQPKLLYSIAGLIDSIKSMADERKLVILHVARTPVTGVWTLIRNLSKWQAANANYTVALRLIVDKKWPRRHYDELRSLSLQMDVKYEKMPWFGFGTLNYISHLAFNPLRKWIIEIERQYEPELIVVHFHNAWLSGAYLPVQAKAAELRFICTFHGVTRARPLFRPIHRFIAQKLSKHKVRLVAVDSKSPIKAEKFFGLRKEAFAIIPNGLYLSANSIVPAGRSKLFVVGYIGYLAEHKGWRVIADAVEILAARGIPIKFVIAGDGPDEEVVRDYADKRADFVEFVGYERDPVLNLLPRLDILALPSNDEGLPMIILEAFSASVPVLATPVGGIPEIITDGLNGFLIERRPDLFTAKIEFLINNHETLDKMRHAAVETFNNRFSMAICGQAYNELYLN